MTRTLQKDKFSIGINMAGAVSAGAYTAGVLDFLIEALEEWQKAKDAYRDYLKSPASANPPEAVPLHDVSIEVFSGASAGGMCAAIAAVMLQHSFEHITTGTEKGTTNTFYESWVNRIDIRDLLGTQDVLGGKPLTSLLDSTIIDRIADYALEPHPIVPRPFVSDGLTLFLTLSNVRGIPYRLYDDPKPTVEEFTAYYGDRLRFEITQPGGLTSSPAAKPLPLGMPPSDHAWPLLKEAAKATGAFPIFLAPRVLVRDTSDYQTPMWEPLCLTTTSKPIPPTFGPMAPKTWQTLNVDGGVIDNDPFQLAHDFLASRNPLARHCHNPNDPRIANCAVITVAPFPAEAIFDPDYDVKKSSAIGTMLRKLTSALISQSRFYGESLQEITGGPSFSRFVIAPSDPTQPGAKVLQCGSFGAFGGFFDRGFRAHDFLLGRRNCQKFLKTNFILPPANSIIAAGLGRAGTAEREIRDRWRVTDPNPAMRADQDWIPIIPLCGTAAREAMSPPRANITGQSIRQIAVLLVRRLKTIGPLLLDGAPFARVLRVLLCVLLVWPCSFFVKRALCRLLTDALRPNVSD